MNTSENDEPEKFYLGLCMAGAVSAGAYTAGVMDYLLEALEKWEARKIGQKNGQLNERIPTHIVEIPVIGGASAGGMTSVITAESLNHPHLPFNEPDPNDLLADNDNNILYHSWVDLTGQDMFTEMLNTSDITDGDVKSGLNSKFIDEVANRVIKNPTKSWCKPPAYISNPLKVFTTLTNLQGFEYDVAFNATTPSKNNSYYMQIHNDFACFDMTDKPITGANNGWMPLNFQNKTNIEIAMNAAMATGAFPVGLVSRKISRDPIYVNNNPWLEVTKQNPIDPLQTYVSLNVDGGMLNNEPFDKVRELLDKITGLTDTTGNQDYSKFKSTVVMIAPFPSSEPAPINKSEKLLHVIGLTLSAMISQMRAKPDEFKQALEKTCAGQFLIAPSRITDSKKRVQGEKAIACGALGGFSGFLSKKFRVHDFFLGRHNCKIFLRDYFTIPKDNLATNSTFSKGYAGCTMSNFKSQVDDSYQIIPLFETKSFFDFPTFKLSLNSNWPILEKNEIAKFIWPLRFRIHKLLMNIVRLTFWSKIWLWLGSIILLSRMLAGKTIDAIEEALQEWKLLNNKQ